MKRICFLLIVLVLFSSCDKKYKYVEIIQIQDEKGNISVRESENVISATSDTSAYLSAFWRFCVDQKTCADMVKDGTMDMKQKYSPVAFKLYNPSGEDISDIEFYSKQDIENRYIDEFLSPKSNVDSVKIQELLPYFSVKKDEFDPQGRIWYKPQSAPQYTNQNGIYFYFAVKDGKPLSLRFRVQYYAEDWLFFNKLQFSIDDKAYEYIPSNTETDSGNGGKIWEWFDESLTNMDKDLVYALVDANSAKMKFIGRQYYNIKSITKKQIDDMKRTLDLYRAMGGAY